MSVTSDNPALRPLGRLPNRTQETGFDDLPFAVVASPVPRIQTPDNRGVVRQVHERAEAARPVESEARSLQ
jgi:hypothetical protein